MIRINLLPARPRRSLIPEPAVFGVLAAVCVALALTYFYGVWRTNQLNAEINEITAETAALHPRVEDVLQLEASIEDLQARESLLQGLEGRATPWARSVDRSRRQRRRPTCGWRTSRPWLE